MEVARWSMKDSYRVLGAEHANESDVDGTTHISWYHQPPITFISCSPFSRSLRPGGNKSVQCPGLILLEKGHDVTSRGNFPEEIPLVTSWSGYLDV